MINERAIESILLPLATYGAMPRSILQKLPPWLDTSDRTLRRALAKLKAERLIASYYPKFVLLGAAKPIPLWYITDAGRQLVAAHFEDEKYLRRSRLPSRQLLEHYLGIIELHIDFSLAFHNHPTYSLLDWINEWDQPLDRNQKSGRLFVELSRTPRRVCAPDFAFLLQRSEPDGGDLRTKVYFGEFDRHTTQSAARIVRDKAPGYTELLRRAWHRRLWPDQSISEDTFKVLVITSGTAAWRDRLRRGFRTVEESHIYAFASRDAINPLSLLSESVFFSADSDTPKPLVRTSGSEVTHA